MNSGHLSEALCKLTLFPFIPNGVATWQGWVAAEGEEEASKARAADPGGSQGRAGGARQWDFAAE